jgi:hypothetical protein
MTALKDKWSDYCVREVMIKTKEKVTRKILDTKSSEYKNLIGKVDVYHSIKRYQEDALHTSTDELWNLDSVTSWTVDIDGHYPNITTSMLTKATGKLCEALQDHLELSDEELFLWWSGRGYHVAIPGEVLFRVPTSSQENNFKALAAWFQKQFDITAPVKLWDHGTQSIRDVKVSVVDTSIYSSRGMIRIPGSKNSKSRFAEYLPKVRIPLDNFRRLASAETSMDMAKKLQLIATNNYWSNEEWI